jgi:hypothetical protein
MYVSLSKVGFSNEIVFSDVNVTGRISNEGYHKDAITLMMINDNGLMVST